MKGLYQKRGWWYYQAPKPKGGVRPKPVALKTQDEVEAINAVTDHQWNGMILEAETKDTLEVVLPRYYEAKGNDGKATRRQRKTILDNFKDRMGNPRVTDISRDTVMAWRALLASTGGTAETSEAVSPTTLTTYLVVLKAFLNWCVKEKILRKAPDLDMGRKGKVRQSRRQDFHSLEQRERLLAKEDADLDVRIINWFGFFTGLRFGEMLVLNPDWIYISPDKTHGSLRVEPRMIRMRDESMMLWEPKSDRGTRTIPLHERLIGFLLEIDYKKRWPYLIAPEKTLFPPDDKQSYRHDPKKALQRHADACGAGNTNYHKLRHSFGTHLAMGGATMVEIANLLGDTVEVTEDNYVGFSPKIRQGLPGL